MYVVSDKHLSKNVDRTCLFLLTVKNKKYNNYTSWTLLATAAIIFICTLVHYQVCTYIFFGLTKRLRQ